jgi:hypothetical protein
MRFQTFETNKKCLVKEVDIFTKKLILVEIFSLLIATIFLVVPIMINNSWTLKQAISAIYSLCQGNPLCFIVFFMPMFILMRPLLNVLMSLWAVIKKNSCAGIMYALSLPHCLAQVLICLWVAEIISINFNHVADHFALLIGVFFMVNLLTYIIPIIAIKKLITRKLTVDYPIKE